MTTFLEFAARGKVTWWRYGVATALALIIALVLAVALLVALMLMHSVPSDLAAQMVRPTHPVTFFVATGLTFGALLLGFVAAIALLHGKSFSDVTGRWNWRLFGLGALVWVVAEILATLIDFAIAPHGFSVTITSGAGALAISALLGLAVQTFAEEFVFRGYVTQAMLLATRRPIVAAVLSGAVFGSLHIPNGIPQAVGALAFGIAMSLLAIRTGGIAIGYGLHLVNNLFGAVVVVSAADVFRGSPGLITQNTPQLLWWDVAVEIVALAAAVWLIFAALRRGADALPEPEPTAP